MFTLEKSSANYDTEKTGAVDVRLCLKSVINRNIKGLYLFRERLYGLYRFRGGRLFSWIISTSFYFDYV